MVYSASKTQIDTSNTYFSVVEVNFGGSRKSFTSLEGMFEIIHNPVPIKTSPVINPLKRLRDHLDILASMLCH